MKIIIPLLVAFGKAGGWRVISQLANSWVQKGHQVVFLSPYNSKPYYPTIAEILYYNQSGVIVDEATIDLEPKLLGGIRKRKALEKALNKMEGDIVLATHNLTAKPVAKSNIAAKKFYYIQAYEPEYYLKGPIYYKLYNWIAKKSYKLELMQIVNSNMYTNYKEIKTELVVFPGIDLKMFYPKEKIKKKKVIIGTIGRTQDFKGTFYVLEAFEKLRKVYGERIELQMAFGLDEWNQLDGVFVETPENDQELATYYQKIDMYICAGTIQLGAVHYPVLEAYATKTPLITTGYYPSSEENCLLIPIKNSNAIVDAVKLLIENPELMNEKVLKGYEDVQEFSWDSTSQKMLSYFEN